MVSETVSQRRVQVWDFPTRAFHWTLLLLILTAWFTGEEEGAAAQIHMLAGEIIAGMLVFRLVWGFVGGEHARFSDFAAGPNAILTQVRSLFSPKPHRHLGHNPLGGLAVFLLLLTTGVIVAAGLFSGEDAMRGPFAGRGADLSEVHEAAFRILQGLVVLHVIGVIVETFRARDPLVPAMIRGWKPRNADEPAADARRASMAALLFAVALGVATTASLAWLTPAASSYQTTESSEDREEED
jgi:cytochrome b